MIINNNVRSNYLLLIIELKIAMSYEEEAYNPNEEGQHVFQSLSPD